MMILRAVVIADSITGSPPRHGAGRHPGGHDPGAERIANSILDKLWKPLARTANGAAIPTGEKGCCSIRDPTIGTSTRPSISHPPPVYQA